MRIDENARDDGNGRDASGSADDTASYSGVGTSSVDSGGGDTGSGDGGGHVGAGRAGGDSSDGHGQPSVQPSGEGGTGSGGSAGASGDSGSGSSGPTRRKRGRPVGSGKRGIGDTGHRDASGGGSADGETEFALSSPVRLGIPRDVPQRDVRGRGRKKGKTLDDTLANLNSWMFKLMAVATEIPAMELNEIEAGMMGEACADAARALPAKKFKAIENIMGSVAPWLGLAGALVVVVGPRVTMYRDEMRRRRLLKVMPNVRQSVETGNGDGGSPDSGRGDEHTATPGATGEAESDLFGGSEGHGTRSNGNENGLSGRIPISRTHA